MPATRIHPRAQRQELITYGSGTGWDLGDSRDLCELDPYLDDATYTAEFVRLGDWPL